MLSWLKKWLGQSPKPQPQLDEKLLTLEQEIQNLRLELTERNQLVDRLKQQLELSPKPQPQLDEKLLTLEQEIQNLRLELTDRNQLIDKLKQQLEQQRTSENNNINSAVQNQIEQLLTDAAAPVTQLLTQAHLLEQGKPVQAKDVLLVAKRLIRALEDNGLTIVGKVGETVSFDSNLHEPLSASSSITPDTEVVVKFAGVSYQGKVIRKAGVELFSQPQV